MDIITIIVSILGIVANWLIYKKMGRQGWESIIPIYNEYVMFDVLYGNGWKFLLLLIPFYNIYLACKVNIDLAHRFNQSTGFGWGLILLPTIFDCILGFKNDIQWGDGSNNFSFEFTNAFENKSKKADEDAAALLKFKELLDSGAITQEEYEAKKKEILGL